MGSLLSQASSSNPILAASSAEAMFKGLAENALIGVYVLEGQVFRFVNAKLAEMLQYERDELVHIKTILDVVPAEDRALVKGSIEQAAAGEVNEVRYERRALRKDGSVIDVEVFASPMELDGRIVLIGMMLDISLRKKAEGTARLTSLVYQYSSEAMVITDARGVVITVNPAFSDITGYTLDETVGRRLNLLSSGRHDKAFYAAMWKSIHETGAWRGDIWNRRKNGEEYAERLVINTSYNADGSVRCLVGLFSDITTKKLSDELTWRQANYDDLTGLPNRKYFQERLAVEIQKAQVNGTRLGLMFVDLDYFKNINDTLGHQLGDEMLKQVAQRLRQSVRESDIVARLGGDEFTVVLTGIHDEASIDMICGKVLGALAIPYDLNGEVAHMTASLGVALYPDDADQAEGLLRDADLAMYAAKTRGRNSYRFYTPYMKEAAKARWRLSRDLSDALVLDQFVLYYQPIVDLQSGAIIKAEALIRWQHPTQGLMGPGQFIAFAEDTGRIGEVGDWVFREAVNQLATWRAQGAADLQISVNVSPLQLGPEGLDQAEWLWHLKSVGLGGQSIVVEITERMLMDATPPVTEKLLAFRDAGVQVALDDVGTGYSSLSYLKKFHIDFLKIDQSFVQDLDDNASHRAIAETMIMMAHKLGLKVIAEGIETREQLDFLTGVGCDYGQGFYFSRPVPEEQLEQLLSTRFMM